MTAPQQPDKPSEPAQEPTMAVLAEGYAAKAGLHAAAVAPAVVTILKKSRRFIRGASAGSP